VPVLGITLWSEKYNDYELKQLGQTLTNEIKKIPDVASINILGGRSRQVSVTFNKDKMAQARVDFLGINKQTTGEQRTDVGRKPLLSRDTAFSVDAGNFLRTAEEVGNLIIGSNNGQPVYLKTSCNH
jgi:multidrug efflux pump subunit AcrB